MELTQGNCKGDCGKKKGRFEQNNVLLSAFLRRHSLKSGVLKVPTIAKKCFPRV